MNNINKNKGRIDAIALAHGLNNALANTQAVLEEATEHCEELQARLDKGY